VRGTAAANALHYTHRTQPAGGVDRGCHQRASQIAAAIRPDSRSRR